MKPLSIRDLFIVTLIVAMHITICELTVTYRNSMITALFLLSPTLITLWVQYRIGCSWTAGSFLHYGITMVWAYFYGLIFSFFYIRESPSEFFERQSVELDHPLQFATYLLETSAMLGVVTSLLYGIIGYSIVNWWRRTEHSPSTMERGKKTDQASGDLGD